MGAQSNVAPVIIKRKKVVAGDGHHGGAWKVAYADFVTAMMAFFMLMWLLNATTEEQRSGLADYFAPTVTINRISGGGEGAFGGDNVFSKGKLAQNGAPPTPVEGMANGADGVKKSEAEVQAELEKLAETLKALGGESAVMENELQHVVTKLTDEGLVIEIFSLPGAPLFDPGTGGATPLLSRIAELLVQTSQTIQNGVAVGAHVPAEPVVTANSQVWSKSTDQATIMRQLLENEGLSRGRISRVTGYADREPATLNPMDVRNNRLEVIFLR